MTSLPSWITYLLVPPLAVFLRFSFRWIFSLHENPSTKPGVVMIPLRLLAQISEWIFMLAASLAIISGIMECFSFEMDKGIWSLIFGAVFSTTTSFILNTHLWIDNDGMYYRVGVGRMKTIAWSSLDHYEIQKSTDAESGTTYFYLFRSNDGETISISRSSYEVNDLLAKIRTHKSLSEKPYRP